MTASQRFVGRRPSAGIAASLALGLLASPLFAQVADRQGMPGLGFSAAAPLYEPTTDATAEPSAQQPWPVAQAAKTLRAPLLPLSGKKGVLPQALQVSGADASEAPALADATPFNYALGMAYSVSPSYAGSDERKSRLRPVLALEYGRFRLSSSRGSSVLRHGLDTRGSGASATLVESDRFNISASLRIDNGRDASDATRLTGLPEVRSTLRGRVNMGYAITDRWAVGASVSQDLLGRAGGAQLNTGLRYALNLTPQTRFNMGIGAALGDATFMRTQFGVPDSAPGMGSALAPFTPGGGLYSVDAGMGVMTALSRRWVAFGGVTVSQLRGDARRSPLTVKPGSYSATAGIAYRCCP